MRVTASPYNCLRQCFSSFLTFDFSLISTLPSLNNSYSYSFNVLFFILQLISAMCFILNQSATFVSFCSCLSNFIFVREIRYNLIALIE